MLNLNGGSSMCHTDGRIQYLPGFRSPLSGLGPAPLDNLNGPLRSQGDGNGVEGGLNPSPTAA